MDHDKYHALRDAAVSSFNEGSETALAAIIESGDMLYESADWTVWSDEERVVFGIMTGMKLVNPDVQGRAFLATREAGLCTTILGNASRVHEIAKIVWKDVK